jgi:hypothetical protein
LLRRHAWPIVERHRAARDAELLAGLEGRLAHGRAVAGVRPELQSAFSVRVERLWLDRDARSPGGVDPATGALRPPAGDEDALDGIAGLVLEGGGEVVPVAAGALPGGEPVAADLRGGRPPSTA